MALIVPNTEAMAGRHENNASEIMIAMDRFDILIFPKGTFVRVPILFLVRQQTGLTPLEEITAKEFGNSRNNAFFGASFEGRDNAQTRRKNSVLTSLLWAVP